MPEFPVISILISFFPNALEKQIHKEIDLMDQKVAQSKEMRYPK